MNKLVTILILLLAAIPAARAAPFSVNSTDDVLDATPGDGICDTGVPTVDCAVTPCCTLRAAIREANALPGADAISVPTGNYSLTLTGVNDEVALSGDLDITSNLTLSGSGAANTVVDGLFADRVFDIHAGATATLSALTIRNGDGKGNKGGGIRNVATLTILDAIVTNNTDSTEGGGIQNDAIPASLTVRDSTISGNTCPVGKGGGIHNIGDATTTFLLEDVTISGNSAAEGGGIRNMKGTGTLTNVTINGNTATAEGGGIQNRDIATMTLTNVTISGNTATNDGGGMQQQATSAILTNVTITGNSAAAGGKGGGLNNKAGTIQLTNSIIANNLAPGDCFGTITSNGYNLDSDGSCGLGGIGDIPNGTANLGALADNGGPIFTHALLIASQAIDAVLAGCPPPAADARGVVRPVDGDGDLTAACDMGAYEAAVPLTISGTVYEDVNGDSGLGDAVAAGNVRIRLYEDVNDDGLVDAGDTYLNEITSNATTGVYSLPIASGTKFLVAVDSKTVPPSDGLNGGHAQEEIWAEQTYGDNPATPALDVGARLGGRTAGTSDDVDGASTSPANNVYQHLARVDVSGGSVSGVDFAFSFRAVTHVGDSDDDSVENRTAQGSLRQLIQNANAIVGAPTLNVPSGAYVLALTGADEDACLTGDLDVTEALTISGAGADTTAVDGGGIDRVFELFAGTTFSGLTIRGGDAGTAASGGGILIDSVSPLILTDVAITGNAAEFGGGVFAKDNTVSMTRVTLSGNTAVEDGGGGYMDSTITDLTNVTISGNGAGDTGGGIHDNAATETWTHVTLTNNSAGFKGGGVRIGGASTISTLSSIIAGNSASAEPNCNGVLVSLGYNLENTNECALAGTGDIPNGTANLGALADNGGPTFTHALLTGSQAIDAVLAGCPPPAADARGVLRPIDGDGDLTAACDMGAYEAAVPLTISGTVYEDVNGDSGLGDAVAAGNVRIRLYEDVNDDGLVDAGDTYLNEITSNATTGVYSLPIASGTKFLVAVDSKTVPPSDGLNGGHAQEEIWAEQTYGDNPATPALDVGARLGGRTAGTSDDVDGASTSPANNVYQHLARVDVSGGSVSGVDFAFSFRAVTHVGDSDDDSAENRTAQGSLRQLIQNANAIVGAPALAIPAGTYALTLTGAAEDGALTGDLDVTDDVTLAGVSPTATVIDGNRTDRVLHTFAATVQFSDLTLEKGDSQGDHGGGVLIESASVLTLIDTMIRDHDGDRGGGIRVDGDLVMSDSTLYDNRGSQGGAIQSSGSSQSVTLTNVTISANTASSRGGGLELDLTTLINVTVTGNSSPDGGGVYRRGGSVFTVKNSIVAGNPTGGDCSNAFTSTGYNLDGDGTCALTGPGDISSGTANLGPLASNGGPTLTHALLSGSNAIDAIGAGCPPPGTDQRGTIRPQGANCDMGAFEGDSYSISGTLFEDIVGDGLADGAIGSAGNPIEPGARIELWLDGSDGKPDGIDDSYQGFTLSNAGDGSYSFTGYAPGIYWVTVDSGGVDSGPYNAPYDSSDRWAEQTYGPVGAASFDGVSTWTFLGTAGAFYGGAEWDVSDNFPPTNSLPTAEHIARVDLTSGSKNDVDFGFSFNVVTTTRGGSATQDPGAGGGQRTVQGSLRQFITNANAQEDGNTMRFVPAAPTNASGGTDNWWQINVTSTFDTITDVSTVIDGSAYDAADGVTLLDGTLADPTPGMIGTGGNVGVTPLALSQVSKPELELIGSAASNGFILQGDDSIVRRIAARRFAASIQASATATGLLIEQNVLGTSPNALADPGPSERNFASGIGVGTQSSGTIQNNLMGWTGQAGASFSGDGSWTFTDNEIVFAGQAFAFADGLAINGPVNVTVTGNRVASSAGFGISSLGTGSRTIEDNSTIGNGTGNSERANIYIKSDSSIVRKNVVDGAPGPGITVVPGKTGVKITHNHFTNNDGTSIDLIAAGGTITDEREGDGIQLNSGVGACGINAGAGNDGLDYPVIASAAVSGPSVRIQGTACPNSTVEIYKANAGAGDLDSNTDPHGEGELYVDRGPVDGSGNFDFTVSGLIAGDSISAIAIDSTDPTDSAAGDTSEFSVNVTVGAGRTISGTVFEDVNYGGGAGRDLATAAADAPSFSVGRGSVTVELYDLSGNFIASTTTSVVDGTYSFTGQAAAKQIVRVVSDTVTSSRTGSDGSELAAQTYRIDGDGELAGDGARKVGGEFPSREDAAANSGAQTLASLQGTDLDTDGVTEWTQSIVTVDATGGNVTGVDFGFNFDVIVNTNDAGQGSLRQFILNSNLLN